MAFLVQTRFKNSFKDFRTQDVDFFENFDDAEPQYFSFCAGAFHVQNSERLQELEAEFEVLGLRTVIRDGFNELIDERNRKIVMNGDRNRIQIFAAVAKVWSLQDGANIGNAISYYYLDGHWLTKAEFEGTFSELIEELGIEDESNDLTFEPTLDGYRQFKKEVLRINPTTEMFRTDLEPRVLYEFLTGKDFYNLSSARARQVRVEMEEKLESL